MKTQLTKNIKFPKVKKYQGLWLISDEGYDFSANPGDYFMHPENHKFVGHSLATRETKGSWTKVKILKFDPTKADLIKWNKKLGAYT